MTDDQKVGGGCQCGCCGDAGDAVEMTGPGDERERLIQLRSDVDDRLAELEPEEPTAG